MLKKAKDTMRHTTENAKKNVLYLWASNKDVDNNNPDKSGERNESECHLEVLELNEIDDGNKQSSLEHAQPESFNNRDDCGFLKEKRAINNLKWKEFAASIDDFSRIWFPLTYSIILAIFLAEAL